ncbi:MAG: carboxypeptidase-like regulatory domain-containing protein [Candidatus Marinimicrobia bacterium]|nr:carboxypeptidase-like regulatory domain-containing protein [Candidatus Neomarinimicrobiota bacterium]
MKIYSIIFGSYGLVLLLSLVACEDAPRNNIFDPESSLYQQSGTLQGSVSGKYLPYDPIPGVKVELANENRFTETNINGEYTFPRLQPGTVSVAYAAEGFDTVEDSVIIQAGKTTTHQIFINGIPVIESVKLITRHIAHWQPTEDEYVLDVAVDVYDYDGSLDVDSVFFQIPSWDFYRVLLRGLNTESYAGIYFNDVFGSYAFPEIQGEPMHFQCKDKSGLLGPIFQSQISRLIISTPQTLSPAGLATVDALPVFRWSHFDAGFAVKYEVDIFRLDESAIPLHMLASPILADTTLRWELDTPLANAHYYWTLTVYDRYDNMSVSREAAFIVESP